MDHSDVSIVIPSYNGQQHLPPLLESLRQLDYPRDRLEILLVDDCSTDQTGQIVQNDFPEVRYLKNEKNLHFAPTINRGCSS
jgi:glycosyltransferase involved in cell wall biosynthesis